MAEQSKLVPARYIGHHAARLAQRLAFNIDGTRRQSSLLESGDTLMMPEREILGFTLLHDPHMVHDPLDLGPGKRVLPEHAGLDAEHLDALGYQFNGGRTDFEPLTIEDIIGPSVEGSLTPVVLPAPAQEPPPTEVPAEAPPAQPDPLTVLSSLSGGN